MAIKEGDFIRLTYTGTVDGDVFDTTDGEKAKEEGIFSAEKTYEPIVIRIGSMHVIPGLDEALVGKEIGEEGEVEIPPEKAYGPIDQSLIRSAPVKGFSEKPTVGTRVQSDGREGVVVNVIGKRALVDFNHPFAGKTLNYTFKIDGVVEDPKEKAQALIKLFSGRDMEVELADGVLTITLPPGIDYDRRWLMGRGMVVHQIFQYLDEVNEVVQVAVFKRPAKIEEPVIEATSGEPADEIDEEVAQQDFEE
jgi:FKBP-type peptidyl-prolyl cis-trans isomerase SlyD